MAEQTHGADDRRRRAVLESALRTFARTGYRATSMDAIARDARISRPGLYFLFASKEALFREAASHVLTQDLASIEEILADTDAPLRDRLVDAFEQWTGRYLNPAAHDIPAVIAENPDLLDAVARTAPARFEKLITAALSETFTDPHPVAQTLGSVSVGLKHQVDTPKAYRTRMAAAVALLIP